MKRIEKENAIVAYKGFDKNLCCRGYKYEVGKEYHAEEDIKVCNNGFHACLNPNDLFAYYAPNEGNRYCKVRLWGDVDDSGSDKIAASDVEIVEEMSIMEVANAKRIFIETNTEDKECNTGDRSSASNTGDRSSASNTGNRSSASNTGYCSSASNTGYCSSASNTGNCSSASNTGDCSSASNTGDRSSAEVSGKASCAAVFGKDSKVRGAIGCALFLVERGEWDEGENVYPIVNVLAFIVDGEKVKADTWYKLVNGKLVEVEE